jgi:hypothetical protein
MRRIEIFWSGNWVEVSFASIKEGDIVRMFESNGTPVRSEGATNFVAMSDSFYSEGWETYMFETEPFFGLNE